MSDFRISPRRLICRRFQIWTVMLFWMTTRTLKALSTAMLILLPALALAKPKADPKWALEKTSSPQAWRITQGRADVVVAIIDTGLDMRHPSLKSHLWVNSGEAGVDAKGRNKATNKMDDDGNGFIDDVHGWDFAARTGSIVDNHGHGTHIAGIIAGLAPGVKLMIVKYYDPHAAPAGNLQSTVKAIEYAVSMKADIINYSAGGRERNDAEETAIRDAEKKGILFVAAAGNEKSDIDGEGFYPAAYELENILSVTAIDPQTRILKSSNYGRHTVDMAAPGLEIHSTLPDGQFGYMTGTSQATAFVSATAALLLSRSTTRLSFGALRSALLATGLRAPGLDTKTASGAELNSYRALSMRDSNVNAFDAVERGPALSAEGADSYIHRSDTH